MGEAGPGAWPELWAVLNGAAMAPLLSSSRSPQADRRGSDCGALYLTSSGDSKRARRACQAGGQGEQTPQRARAPARKGGCGRRLLASIMALIMV